MTSRTRLKLSVLMVFISALYGAVLVQSTQVATAVSSGYIAMLLTVFVITSFWKRP